MSLSALKSTLEINDTTIIIIIITTSTLTDTTGMHYTLGRAPAEMQRLLCAPTCRGRRSPAARFDLSKDRPPCWQRGRGLSAPAVLNRHPARIDKTETGEVAPPGRGKKNDDRTKLQLAGSFTTISDRMGSEVLAVLFDIS